MSRRQRYELAFLLALLANGGRFAVAEAIDTETPFEPLPTVTCRHPIGRRLRPLEDGVQAINRAFVACVGSGKRSQCTQCSVSEAEPKGKPAETNPIAPPDLKRPANMEASHPVTTFIGHSDSPTAPRVLSFSADDGSDSTKIATALRDLKEGKPLADVASQSDVSERVVRGWQRRYQDLPPTVIDQLRIIEEENHRLKRLLAERDLEIDRLRQDRE